MPLPAIGAVAGSLPAAAPQPVGPASPGAPAGAPLGTDFAQALERGLQQVQDLQTTSDQLAVKAATGTLTDVHDYTIAANEASVATSLVVAVRNKAVDAFNEIMRMPM